MMNNSNVKKKANLWDSVVDIEPTGVIYNVPASRIETFVDDYLRGRGITQINKVYVKSNKSGSVINPNDINVYLFLPINSPVIKTSSKSIPEKLRNKLDNIGVGITNEFRESLIPIAGKNIDIGRSNGDVYVKLNLPLILALMFAVDKSTQTIGIIGVSGGNESIFQVVKQINIGGNKNTNNDDKYDRIVRNINHR